MTNIEKPYVPFYKPYGMTDEEYEYEVRLAEYRLEQWESMQTTQPTTNGSIHILPYGGC